MPGVPPPLLWILHTFRTPFAPIISLTFRALHQHSFAPQRTLHTFYALTSRSLHLAHSFITKNVAHSRIHHITLFCALMVTFKLCAHYASQNAYNYFIVWLAILMSLLYCLKGLYFNIVNIDSGLSDILCIAMSMHFIWVTLVNSGNSVKWLFF